MIIKTYVITGAAKPGYGEAITRLLLDQGFSVVGTYDPEDAENAATLQSALKTTDQLRLVATDHADRNSLRSFIDSINTPISGIVHAQFFFAMEDPVNFDHVLWDRSLAINLTAPNFITHELKDRLLDGGSIVVVTSTEGFIGSFGASAYAATKAAMHNLIKTWANNLGSRKIRANVIAAGWIGGVMDTDEVFNMSRQITPLGRLGSPDEIASVAKFLLSDDSAFVNSTVITADGGYTGVDTISKYEFEAFRPGEKD